MGQRRVPREAPIDRAGVTNVAPAEYSRRDVVTWLTIGWPTGLGTRRRRPVGSHYSTHEHVDQIAAERIYFVAARRHQRVGTGLFLTNRPPGARPRSGSSRSCSRWRATNRPSKRLSS